MLQLNPPANRTKDGGRDNRGSDQASGGPGYNEIAEV